RQAAEFRAQSKRSFQQIRKTPRSRSLTQQLLRFRRAPGGSEAGYLSLHDRQFDASDTCWFASAEYSGDCCLLKIIDSHAAGLDLAPQQERQLDVRKQMKPTSKIVARDGFGFPAQRNGYVLQTL